MRTPHHLALSWAALGIATLLLVAGTIAAQLSSTPTQASLLLSPGSSVRLRALRIFPANAGFELEFQRRHGEVRPELGVFASGAVTAPGALMFPSPGEPVLARARGPLGTTDLQAMPASRYGAVIGRHFTFADTDGNPHRLPWPLHMLRPMDLPSGYSTIDFQISHVGAGLRDERVTLVIDPPLAFQTAPPRYELLRLFILWPLGACVLLVGAAVLGWWTRRSMRKARETEHPRSA